MRTIETADDIAEGLAFATLGDARLTEVARIAGPVPLRRHQPGFPGLARIVVGQQLSVASADAIWRRFLTAFPGPAAEAVATASDDTLRAVGLSAPKIRTLKAVATANLGGLDLTGLGERPAEEAHGLLTAIKGIGPWTADIYLLFCLGHPDVFPAGDLALQNAAMKAFGYAERPTAADLAAEAAIWSPWRGVVARLLWAYWHAVNARQTAPL